MPGMSILKNQKKFEMQPMSNGVLIFAVNSEFDYIRSAEFAAKQAKKFLNLPVTLVTNVEVQSEHFDSVIVIDSSISSIRKYREVDDSTLLVRWFNESRTRAYELSPYDKTLLIDADYFMFNSSLKSVFDTDIEIACFDRINDLVGDSPDQIRLNAISIPMVWATVIYFRKSKLAESVFSFIEKIKLNWKYYSSLYLFSSSYRNDYSLSIAIQALTGYSTNHFNRLPGKLHTILSNTKLVEVRDNEIVFARHNKVNKVIDTNVHCMNKTEIRKFYA